MKKIFTLLCGYALLPATLQAQVIFEETFDGISGPTSGGAGTFTFPAGWLLRNVDNRTPASSVAYVNDAWELREDFKFNVADSAAFSTSWYSPEGTSDDWMWTPAIAIPEGTTTELTWNAVVYDPEYPDGYEVRVMTSPDIPTGSAGVIGNQITNSTAIFSTAAENTTWTSRSFDLSVYAGETVYIGFRNNSNDKFLLLIDDVKVESVEPLPVTIISFTGFRSKNENMLQWEVAAQENITAYHVQRSTDGSNFETIGTVSANSQSKFTYNFIDKTAQSGISLYRLAIVEDDKESFTHVVQIRSNVSDAIITLSPNPATSQVKVSSSDQSIQGKSFSILDISGKTIKQSNINAVPFSFDISDIPQGKYMLLIEGQTPKKLVKQ